MSEVKDGGPAFPVPLNPGETYNPENHGPADGMTLRDYFAAKAMQSLVLRPCTYEIDTVQGIAAIAGNAYDIADAMLKAREDK